jgi:UDP-glucose 4-epimerase
MIRKAQTVIFTGARGKLATLTARHFEAIGHRVIRVSRTAGGGFLNFDSLWNGEALRQADALLHFAWSTVPRSSEENPGIEKNVDIPLLKKTLEAARGRDGLHFVFFSSGGTVYGNAGVQPSRESDTPTPIGRYGAAKVEAENLVREFGKNGLACTIARPSNPYGFQVEESRPQGVIPHIFHAAMENRPFQIWGDGTARKDYLFHTDFVSAIERIVAQRALGTFNVCAGESHDLLELIAFAEEIAGVKIATQHTDAPAWDVQRSLLDHSLLSQAVDWQPRVSIHDGMLRCFAAIAAPALAGNAPP